DVPPRLAADAISRSRGQSETPGKEPWPLASWPDVPTRYLLCRKDRLFPAAWVRRVVRERLGIIPDEIDSGHCPALSRPRELADRLEGYRAALGGAKAASRRRAGESSPSAPRASSEGRSRTRWRRAGTRCFARRGGASTRSISRMRPRSAPFTRVSGAST